MIAPVAIVMLLALVLDVQGHGSLIYPLPRGGVDRDLAPFSNGGWPQGHYTCTCVNGTADKCHPAQSCRQGQPAYPLASTDLRTLGAPADPPENQYERLMRTCK